MRNIYLLSFILLIHSSFILAQVGQCNGGGCGGPGNSWGAVQSTTSGTFVNSVAGTWAGEYNTYNVTTGQQYEWSLCPADGAVNPTGDAQLTLKTTANANICYSDDVCGLQPKILWTATFTGQVRVLINQYSCATNSNSHTVRWRNVPPAVPAYQSSWVAMNTGTSNWCPGETRTVSVTVTNNGSAIWTNAAPDINIGVKWNADADYFVRVDANGLLPGATQTYYLTVTAPMTPGTNNLTFDVVNEGNCWFGNNSGSCGPGNTVYTSPAITITPSYTITGTTTVCVGSTTDLNTTDADWTSLPTGGTITTIGNERIHTFTTSGTFSSAQTINNAKVLVVAGGGGGGLRHAGGGGGGGLLYNNSLVVPSGATTVNVGAGGAGVTAGTGNAAVNNGQNSQFGGGMISIGGGFGSCNGQAAGTGGSGGGGSNNLSGQPGIAGQGNKGGNQGCSPSTTVSGCGSGCGGCYPFGCGGGGAGAAALNDPTQGSAGGIGLQFNISGANVFYAGGGGGGRDGAASGYAGGTGGGGAGGGNGGTLAGANGVANTGGGGGGGGANGGASGVGGNGGSGIVIVRYTRPIWTSSNTLVATVDPFSGIVTGVSAGTSTITYNSPGGCSASTLVTVQSITAPQAVANVTVGAVYGGGALLPDANLTATTCWNGDGSGNCSSGAGHEGWRGRLFNAGTTGALAWAAQSNVIGSDYLQIDLGSIKPINAIATQSRGITRTAGANDCCNDQRVTQYEVRISNDGISYTSLGTFAANAAVSQNVVINNLPAGSSGRFVRLYPTAIAGHMSMRADVISIPCFNAGGQTVNLSAEIVPGANTVRWWSAASGGTLLGTGQNFSPTIVSNTTFYAEGYNSVSGCVSPTRTAITAMVTPQNTIAAGQNRTICQGSAIATISLATTGATGATVTGLPAGVTGSWAGNVVTISGTPTESGTFNYTVTTTGGCPPATTTGTITVDSPSTSPTITPIVGTVCPNTNTALTASGGVAGTGSTVNWYTGPNGTGTLVGTGTIVTVAPTASTTYYVRREGTCNVTADASVAINVKNFAYAVNGTSSNTYCTDNAGWNHFFVGDDIIFSLQGNISSAPAGFPVASIADNNAYYQQTQGPGTAPGCSSNQQPGEERFEMERSWNVDMGGGAPIGSYDIRFYFQPAERTAIESAAAAWMAAFPDCGYTYKYPTPNGFYWFKNSGSNYVAPMFEDVQYTSTPGTTSNGVNYAQWTGITGFSGGSGGIILIPIDVLPVELTSLTALCNSTNDEVTVRWTTASEHNSSHFNVERSTDGSSWNLLTTSNAAGNSTITQVYEVMDYDVRAYETLYYRLQQFDHDGASKQYGPVSVSCSDDSNGWMVFPNPAGNEVTILLKGEYSENTQISINDINGKAMQTITYDQKQGQLITVDLRSYAPGVYVVRLMTEDSKVQMVRLVKQ